MEDWALIRRLVAEGVPQRQVARDLGVGRSTVARAMESESPPRYSRPAVVTAFTSFEGRVRAILVEHLEMPATVLAERVGWAGWITWFRDNVRRLRPEHRPPDPAIGWSGWSGRPVMRPRVICGSRRSGSRWKTALPDCCRFW